VKTNLSNSKIFHFIYFLLINILEPFLSDGIKLVAVATGATPNTAFLNASTDSGVLYYSNYSIFKVFLFGLYTLLNNCPV
jgi:uncharacterized protein YhhL (DUF1145 family)